MEAQLQSIRHDLKNMITALRSGCDLVERELGPGDSNREARAILGEMRLELRKGRDAIDRLHPSQLGPPGAGA